MKTTFRIRQPYADIFEKCAKEYKNASPVKPQNFIRKLKNNTGMSKSFFGILDEEGLEYKNPLIVALGDSVTAGHFESLLTQEILENKTPSPDEPIEIFDARESYIEKFRNRLIDKYELTSVSVINSGIAGDTLPSMCKRADRDVFRYKPDLVLINGSLNWDDATMGDSNVYKEMLRELISRCKKETDADIVLLTPNGDLPNTLFGLDAPEPTTEKRAQVIRELAEEEQVCLADVRAVWNNAREKGCPWEELLANRVNHPSFEGHEVYAEVLMKLFEE